MPNPMMKLGGGANTGKRPQDRPEPIAPIVEEIEEPVFAYRGIEDHGVPVKDAPWIDVPGYGATVDAVYEQEADQPHVVPVRIVRDETSGAPEMRVMRVRSVAVGSEPIRVAGRNLRRQSVVLRPSGSYANVGGAAAGADPLGGATYTASWGIGDATNKGIITSGTGRVLSVTVLNPDTVSHTVTIVELTSNVTLASVQVAAGSSVTVPLGGNGVHFNNGLYAALFAGGAPATQTMYAFVTVQRDTLTQTVYVGSNRGEAQNPSLGYPLTDAADNSLTTQDEIWLSVPAALGNQLVTVLVREDVAEAQG